MNYNKKLKYRDICLGNASESHAAAQRGPDGYGSAAHGRSRPDAGDRPPGAPHARPAACALGGVAWSHGARCGDQQRKSARVSGPSVWRRRPCQPAPALPVGDFDQCSRAFVAIICPVFSQQTSVVTARRALSRCWGASKYDTRGELAVLLEEIRERFQEFQKKINYVLSCGCVFLKQAPLRGRERRGGSRWRKSRDMATAALTSEHCREKPAPCHSGPFLILRIKSG